MPEAARTACVIATASSRSTRSQDTTRKRIVDPVPGCATARAAIDRYLDLLSPALGGAVDGVYLTGSAALGDWLPDRSDLDILAVTSRPLNDADLDAIAALHAGAADRPYLDAVYVCSDHLGMRPPAGHPGLPHAVDGAFRRDGYLPGPVLWETLHRHGLTIAGPPAADLRVVPDPAWLREWNLGNLDSYWRRWAAEARVGVADCDPDVPLPAEVVTWGLLGPGRLHYTITTGAVLSKTAAADYTARHFPDYAELLALAKAWRLGDDTVQFMVADAYAACDLIDAVAADARRR
jgi:predicted nucleotidyltransferase